MLAEIILTGFWEVIFYIALVLIIIEFVIIDLPKIINPILDWLLKKKDERLKKKSFEKIQKLKEEYGDKIQKRDGD